MADKLSPQALALIEGGERYYSPTLNSILGLDGVDARKQGLSEERVRNILPQVRDYVGYWREYPDKFIDFLCGENSKFKLFFYQRVFLRAVIRHKYAYATFPRAYSKSFLSVLTLILRCILYPGAKLFVCSGGKEQAASIAKEKIEELCELIPALKREIDWRPGRTLMGKDYVKVEFKNGSRLDVVAARNSARGGRRHGKEERRLPSIFDKVIQIWYNISIKIKRSVCYEFLFFILFIKYQNKQGIYRIY